MITKEELEKDGYRPTVCKIGTLYIKGHWFCRLLDNGNVDFRYIDNDTKSVAILTSIYEIHREEIRYFINLRKYHLQKARQAEDMIKLYNKDNYPDDYDRES